MTTKKKLKKPQKSTRRKRIKHKAYYEASPRRDTDYSEYAYEDSQDSFTVRCKACKFVKDDVDVEYAAALTTAHNKTGARDAEYYY